MLKPVPTLVMLVHSSAVNLGVVLVLNSFL